MAQRIYEITDLPESGIEASATFARDHLDNARALIGVGPDENLVIILPPADTDHAGWRRAAARDLARAHAPARVNVIAGDGQSARMQLLTYLDSANGVTGHYLESQ